RYAHTSGFAKGVSGNQKRSQAAQPKINASASAGSVCRQRESVSFGIRAFSYTSAARQSRYSAGITVKSSVPVYPRHLIQTYQVGCCFPEVDVLVRRS